MENSKYFFIFALAIVCIYFLSSLKSTGSSQNNENSNVLNVSVYYETKCGDSAHFFTNQLSKLVNKPNKNVLINLVPFGKASVRKKIVQSFLFYFPNLSTNGTMGKISGCLNVSMVQKSALEI